MAENNITNIHFIDANRATSKEAKFPEGGTNPAVWTNEVSNGLKLNPGDKVSVAFSCVNQVGCGDKALETSGKSVNHAVTFTTTERTHTRVESVSDTEFNIELGPYGSTKTICKNSATTLTPKDNELNMAISYYKNTNGENYVHLPRRFDSEIDPLQESIAYNELGVQGAGGPSGWKPRNTARQQAWWQPDDATNGRPFTEVPAYRCWADYHWYMGNRHYNPTSTTRLGFDAHNHPDLVRGDKYFDVNVWKKRNDNSRYTLYQAALTFYDHLDPTIQAYDFDRFFGLRDPALQHFRKYKELKRYSVTEGFNDPHNVAYQLTSQLADAKLGPQPIRTHQVGYAATTPSVTSAVPDYDAAISMRTDGEVYKPFAAANWMTMRKGANPGGTANEQSHSTGAYANFYNGEAWASQTADSSTSAPAQALQILAKKQDIVDYQSSYNIVGMKRPEIYDTGMAWVTQFNANQNANAICTALNPAPLGIGQEVGELNQQSLCGLDSLTNQWYKQPQTELIGSAAGGYFGGAAGGLSNHSMWLVLNINWYDQGGLSQDGTKTTVCLEKLRDFFKAQKLYPETLQFPRRDTTNNQAHNTLYRMDTPPLPPTLDYYDDAQTGAQWGQSSPFHKRYLHMNQIKNESKTNNLHDIGNDNCGLTDNTADKLNSQPLWFYYDEAMKDTYVDQPGYSDVPVMPSAWSDAATRAVDGTSSNLCYGFAMKYQDESTGADSKIAINIQGLPVEYLGDGLIWEGDARYNITGIGYDLHFSAYGTSNLVLYSGYLPCDPEQHALVGLNQQGEEVVSGGWKGQGGPTQGPPSGPTYLTGRDQPPEGYGISAMIRQVYVGAIDPIIQFLDSNSRFTIGGLHTPEYEQNPADAGRPLGTDPETYVPTVADEGISIYKINKKITMSNNYTPEMLPYREESSFQAPFYQQGDVVTHEPGPANEQTWMSPCNIWGGLAHSSSTDGYGYIGAGGTWFEGDANNTDPSKDYPPVIHSTGLNTYGEAVSKTANPGASRYIDPKHEYLEVNYNLDLFTVYDSHSGIYLEDLGITDRTDWANSLWGIMGFDFDTFHPSEATRLNRQTKLTRVNFNQMSPLTTCATMETNDCPTFVKNLWQKTLYTQQLPVPLLTNLWFGHMFGLWYANCNRFQLDATVPPRTGWGSQTLGGPPNFHRRRIWQIGDQNQPSIYPMVQTPQISRIIMADGLPVKMRSPYYMIKSDIIGDSYYLRDKTPLPIVAIVNKENGFGDFYFSQESQQQFTIQQPSTITEIRTEIYDTDMSLARCDLNSAVIYKVEKQVAINPDLIQQLIQLGQQGVVEPVKNTESNFGMVYEKSLVKPTQAQADMNQIRAADQVNLPIDTLAEIQAPEAPPPILNQMGEVVPAPGLIGPRNEAPGPTDLVLAAIRHHDETPEDFMSPHSREMVGLIGQIRSVARTPEHHAMADQLEHEQRMRKADEEGKAKLHRPQKTRDIGKDVRKDIKKLGQEHRETKQARQEFEKTPAGQTHLGADTSARGRERRVAGRPAVPREAFDSARKGLKEIMSRPPPT